MLCVIETGQSVRRQIISLTIHFVFDERGQFRRFVSMCAGWVCIECSIRSLLTESEDLDRVRRRRKPPNTDCEYWRGALSTSSNSSRLHGRHAACAFCRSPLRRITCLLLCLLSDSSEDQHSPESSSPLPPSLRIQLPSARLTPRGVVPLMKARPSIETARFSINYRSPFLT